MRRRVHSSFGWLAGCLLASTAMAGSPAYLVRVPVPVTGAVDTIVIRSIDRIRGEVARRPQQPDRCTVVLEFWPTDDASDAPRSSFAEAYQLASYLTGSGLNDLRLIAYLPKSVAGHAVLPVIACEQIIMHPDAKLGPATTGDAAVSATVRSAYREIASQRRTVPVAVALGMVAPDVTVYRVTTDGGVRFELEDDLPSVRESENIKSIDTLIPAGEAGQFSGQTLRVDLGFASHLAVDRRSLAAALDVPVSMLEPDPSLGASWVPIRVDLDGLITEKKVDRAIRMIEERIRIGSVNFVCLYLNSPGGSPEASLQLAGFLAELDSSQVRTVAYVARQALGDAALVATACDHLVIERTSTLGGPGDVNLNAEQLEAVRVAVQDVMRKKGRYWSLPMALIDPDLEINRYTLQGTNVVEFWCPDEWNAQPDPARWKPGEVVCEAGAFLTVTAENAEDLGIANFVVDRFEDLRSAYQMEGAMALVRPNWADEFIEFLASPQIAVTLLFFAGFALMAELSTPGLGAGGFVSAVCFVLFFWSQFLHGTATWLEVLLFITGLMCISAEIFLIPGVGIFGLGGGVLVIGALVLASQTFIVPRNDYQLQQLPKSMLTVVAAAGGVMVGLVLLRRFLEKAPFLRHVVLRPPEGEELQKRQRRETLSDLSWALGRRGVTTTPLMPSGKARVDVRLIDVVSDGEPLAKGTPIEVVAVEAYRVVVRAVDPAGSG